LKKPSRATLLKASLSVLIGLILFEGLSRLLPGRMFQRDPQLRGDALLGIPLSEPDVARDFPEEEKPADVYRIVVLGDSHTVSAAPAARFPERLGSLLGKDELGGRRVEVHNAGALGHSHYQYYLTLTRRLERYHPDLVVVAFYVGNDFMDLYRIDDRPRLSFANGEFVHEPPEFVKNWDPDASGFLEWSRVALVVRACLSKTIGYAWDRTRVLFSVGKRAGHGNLAAARFVSKMIRGSFVNEAIFRQSMNQIVFLRDFPECRAEIERVNRRVTELMQDAAARGGWKLLYAPIPTKLQIEPDSDPGVLQRTLEVCGLERDVLKDEDELCNSLVALLAQHGIESLRLEGPLREAAGAGVLYDDSYHIGERAHAVIAQALHERILPLVRAASAR
jgi:hypothetical protein